METKNKPLGFWMLTSLVVGNMVGSGIFLLPSSLAKFGSISLLSWIITTFGAFMIAIMFSKMSLLVPKNGGPYAYAKAGLGNFIGFQTAYTHWISMWVGNLALIIAMVGYFISLWPVLGNPVYSLILAIVTIWLLTVVNIFGVRPAGVLQITTTILRLVPVILLIVVAAVLFNPHYITDYFDLTSQSPALDINDAASLTLWAFIGIESAVIPYSYVKNPSRNIPLATLIGTGVSAVLYILSSTLILGLLPNEILANTASPFIAAAQLAFGSVWGKWFMTIGAIIACFGCINGWTMLKGQVAMAAADNNLFPNIFAVRNKYNVPALGLIVTAILETTLLFLTVRTQLSEQFHIIILMASLAALIPYFYATVSSIIVIKNLEDSFKNKIYLIIGSLAALYSFWAIFTNGRKALFYGSILVLSSALMYGWGYANKGEDYEHEEEEEEEEEEDIQE